MQDAKEVLRAAHIPTFDTPEQAVRGFMHLMAYAKTREVLRLDAEQPPSVCARVVLPNSLEQLVTGQSSTGQSSTGQRSTGQRSTANRMLSQVDSKRLLQAYGIPVTPIELATTAEQAVQAAQALGFPVVLKIHSPQITHKTDVQGVRLNLQSAHEVGQQFAVMVAQAGRLRPDAEILGVTVEPMISMVHGVELILGAKRDPIFGAVIMVGYGGIATELFKDHALELPPVSYAAALRMLQSLRCWPLLNGYRGLPQVDVNALAEVIERFSTMIVEQPGILEADVNPLVVSSEKMIALDARILLAAAVDPKTEPYAHLAILPTERQAMR
jgi:acetyltransferase